MKKLIYIIAMCMMIMNISCDDFLDTPAKSSLDDEVIFTSYDLAKGAIDNIKMGFTETNSYRGRWIPYYGMNTDCDFWLGSKDLGDKSDLMVYDAKPNNNQWSGSNAQWEAGYASIEMANICIENLKEYADLENDEGLRHLYGEALTLRAVYYADLLKTHGDIPARFEPIATETIYIPKSDRDIIYKQLLADLEEAAEYVSWPGASDYTSETTHVNKAFIKALRARLAINAGGYSQRPDETVRKSTDDDLSTDKMMAIVKQECLDIIGSGSAGLEDFETVFRKIAKETNAPGGEALWEIPMSNSRGRFYYVFAVAHNGIDQYTGQAKGGNAGPMPNLWYDYDEKDLRREVSIVPYSWGDPVDGIAKQELSSITSWNYGKYRYEWMDRYVTSAFDDGISKVYLRYSEVILMLAEAINYIDGVDAAKPYLRMIRERSFAQENWIDKVDNYLAAITSKEDMLKAIQDEHKWEFVGEMNRKEALIRWNILGSSLNETKARILALRSRTIGSYDDVEFDYSDVPEKLHFKYDDDGESLIIYGLNRGEHVKPSEEYESDTWVSETSIEDEVINTIFVRDPDTRQFWPIWEQYIVNSQGSLVNDYGY